MYSLQSSSQKFSYGKEHTELRTQFDKCLPRQLFSIWAPSSEFVSSSIPSWQILTAHAQQFRGARDLAFCLKLPLDSLPVWASSEGSGETARMRRLAWTFAARIGDKYQIRLTRSIWYLTMQVKPGRPGNILLHMQYLACHAKYSHVFVIIVRMWGWCHYTKSVWPEYVHTIICRVLLTSWAILKNTQEFIYYTTV